MTDSEKEFLEECAERQGKTLKELTEDDRRFWSGESNE